jgi:hypothetical protein
MGNSVLQQPFRKKAIHEVKFSFGVQIGFHEASMLLSVCLRTFDVSFWRAQLADRLLTSSIGNGLRPVLTRVTSSRVRIIARGIVE